MIQRIFFLLTFFCVTVSKNSFAGEEVVAIKSLKTHIQPIYIVTRPCADSLCDRGLIKDLISCKQTAIGNVLHYNTRLKLDNVHGQKKFFPLLIRETKKGGYENLGSFIGMEDDQDVVAACKDGRALYYKKGRGVIIYSLHRRPNRKIPNAVRQIVVEDMQHIIIQMLMSDLLEEDELTSDKQETVINAKSVGKQETELSKEFMIPNLEDEDDITFHNKVDCLFFGASIAVMFVAVCITDLMGRYSIL